MNCPEVQSRLSAFYDGHLPNDVRPAVEAHLRGCAECSTILSSFEALTQLAHQAPAPEPSPLIWQRICEQLANSETANSEAAGSTTDQAETQPRVAAPVARPVVERHRLAVLACLAAALVAMLAVGVGLRTPVRRDVHKLGELADEFDEYLRTYAENPARAAQGLFAKYPSREVTFDEAVKRVGYRPVVANSLPAGYSVNSVQLMKMPCCDCIKTVCTDARGVPLMIFEHTDREAAWFRNRASRPCKCGGVSARMVEFEHQIAVTWLLGKRSVTVIGDTDFDEIERLMPYLGQEPATG